MSYVPSYTIFEEQDHRCGFAYPKYCALVTVYHSYFLGQPRARYEPRAHVRRNGYLGTTQRGGVVPFQEANLRWEDRVVKRGNVSKGVLLISTTRQGRKEITKNTNSTISDSLGTQKARFYMS